MSGFILIRKRNTFALITRIYTIILSYNSRLSILFDLARLLLSKGAAFCLYQFPFEAEFHLALDKDQMSLKGAPYTEPAFIIAPFIKNDESSEVLLQKLPEKYLNFELKDLIKKTESRERTLDHFPPAIRKEEYIEKCQHYIRDIKKGKLAKAILSRLILVDKPQTFDPFNFLKSLAHRYPETFISLFYIPGSGLWTGASPELLLKKEGQNYQTMALASTQPINPSGIYQWREKEKEEHRLVQEHIEQVFFSNCYHLRAKKGPYDIETGKVAHLRTDYSFRKSAGSSEDIASLLHPTPAIGGLPVAEALECIAAYEGYNRNYYTGYLGETNQRDFSRLYINLRCMQIGSEQIALYVGGGISADSDPEEEWAETNQKGLTLMELITDPARYHATKS